MEPNAALTLTDEVRAHGARETPPFLAAQSIRNFSPYAAMLATLWPASRMLDGWATAVVAISAIFLCCLHRDHALMRGDDGKLSKKVPNGLFSLELPGSQGSHPGHSGILQGDPETSIRSRE